MSYEVTASTRVRSGENIMQGRRATISIVVNPWKQEPVIIHGEAKAMRALARMLHRHANFIDPPKKRQTRRAT